MKRYAWLIFPVVLWVAVARAQQPATFQLRLVPVQQGMAGDRRGPEPEIVTKARKLGIDMANPSHPLLVHSFKDGRLFHAFYKTVEQAHGPQSYLIQRIRKTERFYATPNDPNPRTQVTFLVEVFKLRDGALKKPDQHYGSYGLSQYHKREIVKEYEVGFGQIPNIAQGAAWPFERNVLYKSIQDYGPDRTLYDRVQFTQSKTWTLHVAFDKTGWYSVRSPEFGFDAPRTLP